MVRIEKKTVVNRPHAIFETKKKKNANALFVYMIGVSLNWLQMQRKYQMNNDIFFHSKNKHDKSFISYTVKKQQMQKKSNINS